MLVTPMVGEDERGWSVRVTLVDASLSESSIWGLSGLEVGLSLSSPLLAGSSESGCIVEVYACAYAGARCQPLTIDLADQPIRYRAVGEYSLAIFSETPLGKSDQVLTQDLV